MQGPNSKEGREEKGKKWKGRVGSLLLRDGDGKEEKGEKREGEGEGKGEMP